MGTPSWLGLLRWSLNYKDGTAPANFAEASERDRAWLRAAMEEAVRDDNKRMKEIAAHLAELLEGPPAADTNETVTLLDEAHEICEHIDNAGTFVRMGGGRLLLAMASRVEEPAAVRSEALAVLAACAQNNLPVQESLWRGGAMDELRSVIAAADDDVVRLRALGALSCLVRGLGAAEQAMLTPRSVELLEGVLVAGPQSVQAKVFFLARALLSSDESELSRALQLWPVVGQAVALAGDAHFDVREASLLLLNACAAVPGTVDGGPNAVARMVTDFQPGLEAAASMRRDHLEAVAAAGGGGEGELGEEEVGLWRELSAALGLDLGFGQVGAEQHNQQQQQQEPEEAPQEAPGQPVLMLGPPPARPAHVAEPP